MNEATVCAAQAANPTAFEQVMALIATDVGEPMAFGDGRIREWLIKYGPGILQILLMIFGLPPIVIPPIVTPPGPGG